MQKRKEKNNQKNQANCEMKSKQTEKANLDHTNKLNEDKKFYVCAATFNKHISEINIQSKPADKVFTLHSKRTNCAHDNNKNERRCF